MPREVFGKDYDLKLDEAGWVAFEEVKRAAESLAREVEEKSGVEPKIELGCLETKRCLRVRGVIYR